MTIEKFIEQVKDFLGLNNKNNGTDNERLKTLLDKLKENKKKIKDELKTNPPKKRKRELEEELEIVKVHIKKGLKLLS